MGEKNKQGKLEKYLVNKLEDNDSFLTKIVEKFGTKKNRQDFIISFKNSKNKIPNRLTMSRVVEIFVVPATLFLVSPLAALGVLFLFELTDKLDGDIARKNYGVKNKDDVVNSYNLKVGNPGGSVLDGAVDKLKMYILVPTLIITLLFTQLLGLANILPVIFLLSTNFGLEMVIGRINSKSQKRGNEVTTVTSGKIKMWTLAGAMGFSMLSLPFGLVNITAIPAEITPIISALTAGLCTTTIGLQCFNIYEYKKQAKQQDNLRINTKTKEICMEQGEILKDLYSKPNYKDFGKQNEKAVDKPFDDHNKMLEIQNDKSHTLTKRYKPR